MFALEILTRMKNNMLSKSEKFLNEMRRDGKCFVAHFLHTSLELPFSGTVSTIREFLIGIVLLSSPKLKS